MSEISDIREAVAKALEPIKNFQKLAYPKAVPADRSLAVILDRVNYQVAFQSDAGTYSFRVRAFLATNLEEASQGLLDELLTPSGSQSVSAALSVDETFGGTCATSKVIDATGAEPVTTVQGVNGLTCNWQLEIWT